MERTQLVEILKSTNLAVASKDLVPILACFCFDGETVVGYDDLVAISSPCKTEFACAVNAKILLGYLSAHSTDELKFKKTSKNLKVTAGSSDVTLPLMPEEEFVFEFPDEKKGVAIPFDDALVDALEASMLSMGLDPGHPWRLGVTVLFEHDATTMYSTDNLTASEVVTPNDGPPKSLLGSSVVLPPRFCQLIAQLSSREVPKDLIIGEGWVQAIFESGTRLFSRIADTSDVDMYQKTFDSLIPEDYGDTSCDLPEGAVAALNRCLVLLDSAADKKVSLKVEKDKLYIDANSPVGKIAEVMPFSDHDDISVVIGPELMIRALGVAEKVLFTNKAVLFIAKDFVHVVTVIQG